MYERIQPIYYTPDIIQSKFWNTVKYLMSKSSVITYILYIRKYVDTYLTDVCADKQ